MADVDNGKTADGAKGAVSQASVSIEALAYIALFLTALFLRLSDLDLVPISDFEARAALHALHTIDDDVPGAFTVSSSPLTYVTQTAAFSLLGASEFTARFERGAGRAGAGLYASLVPRATEQDAHVHLDRPALMPDDANRRLARG